jgi:protein-S-isoprenylcysteine O-methyltransferase Ste14
MDQRLPGRFPHIIKTNLNKFNELMKTSMTLFGCGPKLALVCLPYVILSLIVMYKYPEFFDLSFLDQSYAKILGYIWLGLGIIYWMYSALFFLRYFKPGKLITQGPFSLCRNPIYSSIIVFIIPSLSIVFHSGLIFSISIVLYIGFKVSIHGETIILRRLFGEEYEIYEKSVNEIIPFPQILFRGKSVQGHDS